MTTPPLISLPVVELPLIPQLCHPFLTQDIRQTNQLEARLFRSPSFSQFISIVMRDEKPAREVLVERVAHSSTSICVTNVVDALCLVFNDSERLHVLVRGRALVYQICGDALRRDDNVATRT